LPYADKDTTMTEPTYESIQPLIVSEEASGSTVAVVFKCPSTGVEATASGSVKKSDSLKAEAGRSVKKNMWSSLRRAVTRAITDAMGSGAAGRTARDVANKAMADKQKGSTYSKDEIRAAVVGAFQSVQTKFRWDAANSQWVGVQAPATPFAKRLAEGPIREKYDQGVLARAMVELSASDGDIGEEERAFMASFLDPDIGSVDDLVKRPKLNAAELAEASEAARGSILMLSWACAMCDEDLAEAEAARLAELAAGLGLEAQAEEMRRDAQQFLFEQALANVYQGGSRDEASFAAAMEAAGKMGIDGATAEKLDAGYRKRCQIV